MFFPGLERARIDGLREICVLRAGGRGFLPWTGVPFPSVSNLSPRFLSCQ